MADKPTAQKRDDNKGHQSYEKEGGNMKPEKAEDVKGHNSYPTEGKSIKK